MSRKILLAVLALAIALFIWWWVKPSDDDKHRGVRKSLQDQQAPITPPSSLQEPAPPQAAPSIDAPPPQPPPTDPRGSKLETTLKAPVAIFLENGFPTYESLQVSVGKEYVANLPEDFRRGFVFVRGLKPRKPQVVLHRDDAMILILANVLPPDPPADPKYLDTVRIMFKGDSGKWEHIIASLNPSRPVFAGFMDLPFGNPKADALARDWARNPREALTGAYGGETDTLTAEERRELTAVVAQSRSNNSVLQSLIDPARVLRTDAEGHIEGRPYSSLLSKLRALEPDS